MALPVAAQQSQGSTVPQPGFETAPSGGTFEVTPLAPPGTTPEAGPDQPTTGQTLPGQVMPGPDAAATGQEIVPGTRAGEADAGGGMVVGALEGNSNLLLEGGGGIDALNEPLGTVDPSGSAVPGGSEGLMRPDGIAVPIAPPPTMPRPGVRLRELDKMTGETETFEVAVGETRQVDRLKIRPEACRSPESNDTHGTIAFLKVWDVRKPDDAAFSGWMFAQSPALSAMDHSRYDLWVISCTTSDAAVSPASE